MKFAGNHGNHKNSFFKSTIFQFKKKFLKWKRYPIGFKLGKNPVHQNRYFKLESLNNPVQIDSVSEDLEGLRSYFFFQNTQIKV